MHARELMTTDPAMITGGDTVAKAAELMRVRGVGMLPVVSTLADRRLIGVITDRDLTVRVLAQGYSSSALVRDHMTRDPLATVSAEDSERAIAEQMKRFQVRRLPVVDSHGTVMGVVAQADVAINVGPQNPELVEQLLESISRPGALTH